MDTRASNQYAKSMTLMNYLPLNIKMNKKEIQIEEIRQAHKALHWSRKVQRQALVERLEDGWTVEDTINTDNGKSHRKFVLERFGKWKTTTE